MFISEKGAFLFSLLATSLFSIFPALSISAYNSVSSCGHDCSETFFLNYDFINCLFKKVNQFFDKAY
jgi:hypothetical protein